MAARHAQFQRNAFPDRCYLGLHPLVCSIPTELEAQLGKTVDFLLTAKRDIAAAKRFFNNAIESNGDPERGAMDKSGGGQDGHRYDQCRPRRADPGAPNQIPHQYRGAGPPRYQASDRADAQLQIIPFCRLRNNRHRVHAHNPQEPVRNESHSDDVVNRPILCAIRTDPPNLRVEAACRDSFAL